MKQFADTLLVKPLPSRRGQNMWLRRAMRFAMIVMLVNAVVGESGLAAALRVRNEYAQAQARLSALRHENASLTERARRLVVDPRMLETVAREELGFIGPGEVVFVLKGSK